jgi:glycosyltransferase involved in cell wall biosynthesis
MQPLLGIGVITRNRLSTLKTCVAEIARYTHVPFTLAIADDGSTDGTQNWVRNRGIRFVTGTRRGCAWNKNRALYYLQTYTNCDPILLIEDDTWPISHGWDDVWMAAARKWQHVNYCYGLDPQNRPAGRGTADNPYQCNAFGGQFTITTRQALAAVGFLDSRFVGYGWEHVEWTHRFRLRYLKEWSLPEGMLPCLDYGVRVTWSTSFFNQKEVDRNGKVYASIRASISGPYYTLAWRDNSERQHLQEEVIKGWKAMPFR